MPIDPGTRQDIEITYHRYRCQSCARTFCEEIPFKHPETRITERAASWISAFLRFSLPISTVQEITGVHWDTIKRIQKEIMDEAIADRRRKLLREGYKPKHLAVDEFAIHKGHRYAKCVMDLDTQGRLYIGLFLRPTVLCAFSANIFMKTTMLIYKTIQRQSTYSTLLFLKVPLCRRSR